MKNKQKTTKLNDNVSLSSQSPVDSATDETSLSTFDAFDLFGSAL